MTVSIDDHNLPSFAGARAQRRTDQPTTLVELLGPGSLEGWTDFLDREAVSVRALLHTEGALVFRQAGLTSPDACNQFARCLSGELLEYSERSSPRHAVRGRVYTSTDYPAREEIFLHNESSYRTTWPLTLFFFCLQPADEGGDTPVADTRAMMGDIDPAVLDRFRQLGWMHQRTFRQHLGIPWRTAFNTDDPQVVEDYCTANDIRFEWRDANTLQTRAVRQAVHQHPVTGASVWFNHATFFHPTTLPTRTRNALLSTYPEAEFPNVTYYGDGSPIEPDVVGHLRACYRARLSLTRLAKGEALVIDNMLVAHGRQPYVGERQVLVAMAEPTGQRAG